MAKRLLPKRRVSLARELSESCRVGPRVWAMVGLAFLITGIFEKFVWVALALWLLFVLREILVGLAGWAVSEFLRWISAARTMPTASREPKVVSPTASAPVRGNVIDVRAEEISAVSAGAPRGQPLRS